jgi:hypothetical protein
MPSTVIAAHKLPKDALARNKKMGRYFETSNGLKVGVGIPVELIGKKCLHVSAAIQARWQANGVHDD